MSGKDETAALLQLAAYEKKKGARSTQRHPAFVSMATLDPHRLSAEQVGLALVWVGEVTAAEKLSVERGRIRLAAALPKNALLSFNLALDEACKLAS